jgi:hypothetical protein
MSRAYTEIPQRITSSSDKSGASTMSMIGNFLQISPAELASLIADPNSVESFI